MNVRCDRRHWLHIRCNILKSSKVCCKCIWIYINILISKYRSHGKAAVCWVPPITIIRVVLSVRTQRTFRRMMVFCRARNLHKSIYLHSLGYKPNHFSPIRRCCCYFVFVFVCLFVCFVLFWIHKLQCSIHMGERIRMSNMYILER